MGDLYYLKCDLILDKDLICMPFTNKPKSFFSCKSDYYYMNDDSGL